MRLAFYRKRVWWVMPSLVLACLLYGWRVRSVSTRALAPRLRESASGAPASLARPPGTPTTSNGTGQSRHAKGKKQGDGERPSVKSVTAARPKITPVGKHSATLPAHEDNKPSFRQIKSTNKTTTDSSEPSLGGGSVGLSSGNKPSSNGKRPSPNVPRVVGSGSRGAVGSVRSRVTEVVGGAGFVGRDKSDQRATVKKLGLPTDDFGDIDPRLLPTRALKGGLSDTVGQCTAQNHVAFLKVHKAASSTVANILQRYGFTRQLNFVLPNRPFKSSGYNYINKPGEPLTPNSLLPPPPGQGYDILWNHAIYDRPTFHRFMPPDTVYVTILREPFQQFVSAYAFYNAIRANTSRLLRVNPFSRFLHNVTHSRRPLDYFHNKQSEDLGMSAEQVRNDELRHEYLRRLSRDLNLVMITEYFDESLVLLRRLMCWSVKDLLYIPKNKNAHKPSFVFSGHDYAKHRQISSADYELYEYFRLKFLRTLAAQGVDFQQEVNHFKDVLQHVQMFCGQGGMNAEEQFFVPRSQWSEQFVVTKQDCQLLVMPELSFLNLLLSARFAYGDLIPNSSLAQKSENGPDQVKYNQVQSGPPLGGNNPLQPRNNPVPGGNVPGPGNPVISRNRVVQLENDPVRKRNDPANV